MTFFEVAERKGLEPSASDVTGRRYNRLNYRSTICFERNSFNIYGKMQKHYFFEVAERKGLEPSASDVTGRRYNRLNYRSAM